jgi:peptidoglycan/xylan/chitin deacetylase (PgdA/CDA1 family)
VAFHPLSPFTSTNLVLHFHRTPSAAWFRQALETVGRLYRFVAIDDVRGFLSGERRVNGACHVTFDDGDRSFVEVALPVLEALGVPATLFVAPGVLASGRNYWFQELHYVRQRVDAAAIRRQIAVQMAWDYAQLAPHSINVLFKALPLAAMWQVIDALEQAHGLPPAPAANISLEEAARLDRHPLVTIGAHSLTHPVLANESDAEAGRQIAGSVEQLAALLGRPVRDFAYPNGAAGLDYGPREQAMLRKAGVQLAFATDSGYFGPATNPLAIPRAGLAAAARETSPWIWTKLLLTPVWDRLRRDKENQERRRLAALPPTQPVPG